MRYLVLLLVLVVEARPADACTCGPDTSRLITPAKDATNVSLNARLVLRLDEMAQQVTLRGGGTTVAVELGQLLADRTGSRQLATPAAELLPNTQYEVYVDEEIPIGSFITGSDRDTTPPSAAGLTAITPEVIAWPAMCAAACRTRSLDGDISRFRFVYDRPLDVVHAFAEVYPQGDASGELVPLGELVDQSLCGALFEAIAPGVTYCARAVVFDEAGNRAVGEEVCGAPARCAPETTTTCEPVRACEPVDDGGCNAGGGNAGWLALLAISLGSRTRSARRRRTRAPRPSP